MDFRKQPSLIPSSVVPQKEMNVYNEKTKLCHKLQTLSYKSISEFCLCFAQFFSPFFPIYYLYYIFLLVCQTWQNNDLRQGTGTTYLSSIVVEHADHTDRYDLVDSSSQRATAEGKDHGDTLFLSCLCDILQDIIDTS